MNIDLFEILTPAQKQSVRDKAYEKMLEAMESTSINPIEYDIQKTIKEIMSTMAEDFRDNGYTEKMYEAMEKHCLSELKRKLKG